MKKMHFFRTIGVAVLICIMINLSGCSNKQKQFEFDICGKWEVVGESGVERAQPGCVIFFDGSKSNLVVPSSNYSFYTTRTDAAYVGKLSFTIYEQGNISLEVNIIDADNIELLLNGDAKAMLKRISTTDVAPNWVDIYKTFLINQEQDEFFDYEKYGYDVETMRFGIFDMNNNGTPELLVQYIYNRASDGTTGGDYDIFEYNNNYEMNEVAKNNSKKEDIFKYSTNNDYPGLFVEGMDASYYLYDTHDELIRTNYVSIGGENDNSPELIEAYKTSIPIRLNDIGQILSYDWTYK